MSGHNKLCVIIPVHRPHPSADELISLRAAHEQLSGYSCYLIFPDGMDTNDYIKVFPSLKLNPVNTKWLSSVQQYNKLKLNLDFYRSFSRYQYMLTYELDAYIFSADFESVGAFDVDFIGAPFFEGYWEAKPGAKLVAGCNSGFSIRNISSCIAVLQSMHQLKFKWWLWKLFLSHSSKLRIWLNNVTGKKYELYLSGTFAFHFADFHLNEDVAWSEVVPRLFPQFKVADPMTALKFSFEYNLEDSLKLNNDKLSLGCHAWGKHRRFWARYIQMDV